MNSYSWELIVKLNVDIRRRFENAEEIAKFILSPECTDEMIHYIDVDNNTYTTLSVAVRNNNNKAVDALIKRGADINWKHPITKCNPLFDAIFSNNPTEKDKQNNFKIIKALINANSDLIDEKNFSAFTIACDQQKIEVLPLLFSKNIDVHFKDRKGYTGLDYLKKHDNKAGMMLVEKYFLHKKLKEELTNNGIEVKKPKI
jgi:ankyrin repeat protein